jgi:hypothetical protein
MVQNDYLKRYGCYLLLLLCLFLTACSSKSYLDKAGQFIPKQKYLVGAGSVVYYTAQDSGTIYLVAKAGRERKVFLSRFVQEGDDMGFDLEDSRIQNALRQSSLVNIKSVEMYFVPSQ